MGSERGQQGIARCRPDPCSVLRQSALFEGLDDAHLLELVRRGGVGLFEPRQTVFLEGDRAEGFYVVLRGRVKVFKLSPRGREQTLMVMGPGDPVGEVAVLSGEAYPASAETLSRAFQQLSRSGALETRGRRVHMKDRKLMERVAGVR